jgi:nucleoid-associated protein YgaU
MHGLDRLLGEVASAVLVACIGYVAAGAAVRIAVIRPRVGPRWRPSCLPLVGTGLALAAPSAAAQNAPGLSAVTANEDRSDDATPRDPTSPLPGSTGRHSPQAPPWSEPSGFPPPRPVGRTGEALARGAHEAKGRDTSRPPRSRGTVEVRPGDSLWSIAAEVLDTSDPAHIAQYWPRLHRANRGVIGPDPNLIFPGQILELPEETPRP